MTLLRFPNPGSDWPRMIESFRTIAHAAASPPNDGRPFDLDFMVGALIQARQVSSSGASGQVALQRSTRADRSRDPLFNQLKMYSELYRMLGWLHHTRRRSVFVVSPLGEYIAAEYPRPTSREVQHLATECLLAITFPNPHTENIGIRNLRPFPFLLRLMAELDGITRDEMLVSLYPIEDDQVTGVFDAALERVRGVRGDFAALQEEVQAVAEGRQVNTLKNYTRFPIGVIQAPAVAWAGCRRDRTLYNRSVPLLQLTPRGADLAGALSTIVDVRESELARYPEEMRAHFALVAAYAMVERAGYPIDEVLPLIKNSTRAASKIFDELTIPSRDAILYSPYQQAGDGVLAGVDRIHT
jgi:hypothetical protein